MARYFPKSRISAIHGQTSVVNGRLIMPMYHPAAALHQPSLRRTIEADFALIPELIAHAEQTLSQEDDPPPDPEQLSLF
jgi:DNA polymerase